MADRIVLYVETDVEPLLNQMDLKREKLIDVVRSAAGERALCTNNDIRGYDLITMNAEVVRGLRDVFCGPRWEKDETDNQEGIRNLHIGVRVIACNFDEYAGHLTKDPTNLRPKGNASNKKVRCNGTAWLPGFDDIPTQSGSDLKTWLLGSYVAEDGSIRAELSLPLNFDNQQFRRYETRIILLDGTEDRPHGAARQSDSGNPVGIVDINVKRK